MLGLPYVKPESLLYTSGSNWEYQPDPSLKQILRRELKSHYENFILGRFDKLNLPIYLFLSGAGTGKSRNANEFHQTAITCLSAQEDEELLTRIKEMRMASPYDQMNPTLILPLALVCYFNFSERK